MSQLVGSGTVRKRGLTLIEVIVVLGILVTLIVVLLPAIIGSREAARRAHCRENCKRIGLALANYENAMVVFPPAQIVGSSADTCAPLGVFREDDMRFVRAPWTITIDPYVIDLCLYNGYNFQLGFMGRMDLTEGISDLTSGYNVTFGQTTGPGLQGQWSYSDFAGSQYGYRCPSNPACTTDLYINCYYACMGGGGGGVDASAAPVDRAQSGTSQNPLAPCFGGIPATSPGRAPGPGSGAVPGGTPARGRLAWNNGIMHLNSSTTLKSITDGAANTVIAGETLYVGLIRNYSPSGRPGRTIFGTPQCGAWMWSSTVRNAATTAGGNDGFVLFNTAATWCPINTCWFDGTFAECRRRGGATGYSQIMAGFSSWHNGGAHHIFADGSVRFINESVDLATYQKLGSKDSRPLQVGCTVPPGNSGPSPELAGLDY